MTLSSNYFYIIQNELKDQFRAFRLRRLGKVPGKRASEELVLQALQRETLAVVMEQRRKMSIEDREKDEVYFTYCLFCFEDITQYNTT